MIKFNTRYKRLVWQTRGGKKGNRKNKIEYCSKDAQLLCQYAIFTQLYRRSSQILLRLSTEVNGWSRVLEYLTTKWTLFRKNTTLDNPSFWIITAILLITLERLYIKSSSFKMPLQRNFKIQHRRQWLGITTSLIYFFYSQSIVSWFFFTEVLKDILITLKFLKLNSTGK